KQTIQSIKFSQSIAITAPVKDNQLRLLSLIIENYWNSMHLKIFKIYMCTCILFLILCSHCILIVSTLLCLFCFPTLQFFFFSLQNVTLVFFDIYKNYKNIFYPKTFDG